MRSECYLGLVQGVQVVRGGGEHLARFVSQRRDQAGVVFQLNSAGYGHLLGLRRALDKVLFDYQASNISLISTWLT